MYCTRFAFSLVFKKWVLLLLPAAAAADAADAACAAASVVAAAASLAAAAAAAAAAFPGAAAATTTTNLWHLIHLVMGGFWCWVFGVLQGQPLRQLIFVCFLIVFS